MTKTTSGEDEMFTASTEGDLEDDDEVFAAFGLSDVEAKGVTIIRGKPYQHGKPQEVPETLRRYIEATDEV